MKANSKGFTLVELIVVITILAILATIGFLSLQGYTSDAKNTKTQTNLRTVSESLVNESGVTGQALSAYLNDIAGTAAATNNSWSGSFSATNGTGLVYSGTEVSFMSGAYYAGRINASALRIDPAKFFDSNAAGAQQPFAVGALSFQETSGGKARLRTVFQAAGTLNNAGVETALIEGTYGTGTSTDVAGLLRGTGASSTAYAAGTAIVAGGSNIPYSLK